MSSSSNSTAGHMKRSFNAFLMIPQGNVTDICLNYICICRFKSIYVDLNFGFALSQIDLNSMVNLPKSDTQVSDHSTP